MAWLQNLAGKAEDLLVKFDQNAANVFNDPNQKHISESSMINEADTITINPSQEIVTVRPSKSSVNIPIDVTNDNLAPENGEASIFSDNVSVISEKSKISDNDDSGIVFQIAALENKGDSSSPTHVNTTESSKKDSKSEYSGISSKSGSLQNSFILMDDTVIKYEEKIAKLERENEEVHHQLINIRHLYSELQNENSNLQNQVERTNELLAVVQKEMEQYKARAQRVLLEKEKLIEINQKSLNVEPTNADQIFANYNEELKKELTFQEEKCQELTEKLHKANVELSVLNQTYITAQKEYQTSKHVLQETVMNERKIRASMEEEYRHKIKELQGAMQEIAQQNNIISSKSQEILHLQGLLKQKNTFKGNEDMESHLQSLTQTLMSKQNALETVTTERNAMRLQLEKLENEHHKVLIQLQKSQAKNISELEADEVKPQIPTFLRISPFDAGVTRRVKHAYSSLDAVSIRTGVFLRRYPVARVFVFCYMVLLHLWVLIILCTYVPTSS